MNKQYILEAYADGSSMSYLAESFGTTEEEVKGILITYKEENRFKKSFTDEFRKMIAERDLNGVTRNAIAKELELNVNTVKKSCEAFGQAVKGKATSDNAFTRIDGDFELDTCPNCGSKRNNLVDENTTYCRDCDSEHEYYEGYILKINYEYLEE